MVKSNKFVLDIVIRYVIALVIAIPNLYLFYWIFTPLTVNLSSSFLSPFYTLSVIGNTLIVNNLSIELIPACIAGSAYYLLVLLNLLTPMPIRTRINSLIFLLLSLLIVNSLRIAIFAALALNNFTYFDITHKLTWYIGSTLFVIIIWFISVVMFKISRIPVYTDIRRIINDIHR